MLDADIRGFFDTIDHGWLVKFSSTGSRTGVSAADPEMADGGSARE